MLNFEQVKNKIYGCYNFPFLPNTYAFFVGAIKVRDQLLPHVEENTTKAIKNFYARD